MTIESVTKKMIWKDDVEIGANIVMNIAWSITKYDPFHRYMIQFIGSIPCLYHGIKWVYAYLRQNTTESTAPRIDHWAESVHERELSLFPRADQFLQILKTSRQLCSKHSQSLHHRKFGDFVSGELQMRNNSEVRERSNRRRPLYNSAELTYSANSLLSFKWFSTDILTLVSD